MTTLEQWRFEADGGDWADVLRRAHRRRAPRLVVAVAAALALAAPAFALVQHTFGNGHGPRLTATLRGRGGEAGTFTISPRSVMIPASRKSSPRVFSHGPRVTMTWELDLEGAGNVTALRLLDRRGRRTTLCAPCTRNTGRATLPLRGATFLFGPHASVRAVVDGTTLTGRLRSRR